MPFGLQGVQSLPLRLHLTLHRQKRAASISSPKIGSMIVRAGDTRRSPATPSVGCGCAGVGDGEASSLMRSGAREVAFSRDAFDCPRCCCEHALSKEVCSIRNAGVEIPTSCEQGVCGTCLTRVIQGEPDHRDHFLTDAEREKNDQFLLCCSRSKSHLLVLDL